MQQNPYPDGSFSSEPTEANPVPAQDSIQSARPVYPQYVQNTPPVGQHVAYTEIERQNAERVVAEQDRAYTTAFTVGKVIDYIGWVLLVLEVALAVRFIFKLIGADPTNPFTNFLYNLTNIFLFVFKGIVANPTFGANGAEVLEATTLIAMAIYGLIFLLLKLLLRTAISRPNEPVA